MGYIESLTWWTRALVLDTWAARERKHPARTKSLISVVNPIGNEIDLGWLRRMC